MKKILIAQNDSLCECLIATSLIKGFIKNFPDAEITCVAETEETQKLFKYNKRISKLYLKDKDFDKYSNETYSRVVNLNPKSDIINYKADELFGFYSKNEKPEARGVLYETKKTKKNIFQLYYNMAGLVWRGEGYDINYFPKTKTKHGCTGLAIANTNLRNYVIDKLELNKSKIWVIPFRKNVYKKFDEINKCENVVTDDFLTLNIALSLRKFTSFLKVVPFNFKLEMFGSGEVFEVPSFVTL